MRNQKNELDKLEETVDQVLSPERAMRWMVRIVVLIVILGVCGVMGRVALHMLGKVDKAVQEVEQEEEQAAQQKRDQELQASLDHNWFVLKKDEIDAATLAVSQRREALEQHQQVAANRGLLAFKGKEDRRESARLQREITIAQSNRLELIRRYNAMATKVGPSVLGDLPPHIEVAEVPEPSPTPSSD